MTSKTWKQAVLIVLLSLTGILSAQEQHADSAIQWETAQKDQPLNRRQGIPIPSPWAEAIDETWGEGLPTEEKLAIFDNWMGVLENDFACFNNLENERFYQWRDHYRREIEQGVSRGRFAAILNHSGRHLMESHTRALDLEVNAFTPVRPGIPLMMTGSTGYNNGFGAALTPLPDKTLLVYQVHPENPLGLQPGDIVYGYDGYAWNRLWRKLILAELPIVGGWGSSPSSYEHGMLAAAGKNWHLFETIQIRRRGSEEVESLELTPLTTWDEDLFATEQLPVPGVPKNTFEQIVEGDMVSWGIVEGTQIGYIYVWAWQGTAGTRFTQAVRDLLENHETEGLIFDFRLNYGGNMFLSDEALGYLFSGRTPTIGWSGRDPEGGLRDMVDRGVDRRYDIRGLGDGYQNPIAVLVGPGAVSSGDQVAYRMWLHPQARSFGKSTATAFNAPTAVELGEGFYAAVADAEAHIAGEPDQHLTHQEFPVDEPIWLTPEDVAEGRDTVVEAAITWIQSQ